MVKNKYIINRKYILMRIICLTSPVNNFKEIPVMCYTL